MLTKPRYDSSRSFERVFPDSNNSPSRLAEGLVGFAILCPVASEFGKPIVSVACWNPPAARAAMPKAPVNKDDNTALTESEIGAARQTEMPAPTRDAIFAEKLDHPHFGRFVAKLPYARHVPGTLRFGVRICHYLFSLRAASLLTPRNLSLLKWIIWLGSSSIHTSVSHAISPR